MPDSGPTRTAQPPGRGVLVALISGRGVHATVPIPARPRIHLGRDAPCEIRIADDSVSRRHAVLHVGEKLEVEDLDSSNGTFVNNEKLASGRRAAIAPGDALRLGDVLVVLHWSTPEAERSPAGDDIVIASESMRKLHELVRQVAATDMSVFVLGETGAGKEVVARRVHALSRRAGEPFLGLNCAAFSEQLLESELFGHEKGAFTGADQAKPGLFETAEGGTVFLDEIAEMPQALQAKLLRVLEERAVLRVGSLAPRAIDVRFVTATNREVEVEMANGRFRKDLYYRLAGFTLTVPPLRHRVEEIEPLARRFARAYASANARTAPDLSPEALEILRKHPWPGNVRELRNVIERAMVLARSGPIQPTHIILDPAPALVDVPPARDDTPARGAIVAEVEDERERIIAALEACAGNQSKAAEMLGISRRTILTKLDKYGIPRPRKGNNP